MRKPIVEEDVAADHERLAEAGDPEDLTGGLATDPEAEQRVRQKWQQIRCYGFECSGYKFIAPLNIYCELLTQMRVQALPNTPEHFLGLCNVRGNLVPVYQLEPLLQLSIPIAKYALVIGKLEQAAALVIASKPKPFDLREFEQTEPTEDLPKVLQPAMAACYQRDGETRYLLDHTRLFTNLANSQLLYST